jgi:hypothetical protein
MVFCDRKKRKLLLTDPDLESWTEFITVMFKDKKNGEKNNSNSQHRTDDPILCPCRGYARAVQRVVITVSGWTPDTLLCTVRTGMTMTHITNKFTLKVLCHTCSIYGGEQTFGFALSEIGNKSLCSGATWLYF